MDVAVRRIPEDWYKVSSSALLSLEVVTKLNDIVLDIIQFRISGSYDSENLALLGRIRDHFCFPAVPACSAAKGVRLQRESFGGQRQPQYCNRCTAARGNASLPAATNGFFTQLLEDSYAPSGQSEWLLGAFLKELTHLFHLGTRHL